MSDPIFLTVEDVEDIHAESLTRFGGGDGVRSRAQLESAVGTPQAGFAGQYLHPTLFDMAAAYAFHIAESQPFVDGNKRAGLGAALVFLGLNGIEIDDPEPEEKLYAAMMEVAAHALDKPGLANVLRQLTNTATFPSL